MPRLALDGNPIFECEWRRIGHQCGGVKGSQHGDPEPVAGLGLAAAHGGAVKSGVWVKSTWPPALG